MFIRGFLFFLVLSVQAHSAEDCELNKVRYQLPNRGFQFTTLNYFTQTNTDKVIILFPPVEGTSLLDRGTAQYLCNSGISTVILDKWTGSNTEYTIRNLGFHQEELEAARLAVLSLTNELYKDKNVGVLAFSKGAIGATVYRKNFSPNVKSMFLVAAGAPLHLTISRAGEKTLQTLREHRLAYYGIGQTEYDNLIEQALVFKTERSKGNLKVAMVTSSADNTVPTYLQDNLVQLWRPDLHWRTSVGHFGTVVHTHVNLKGRVFSFFNQTL